MPPSKLIVFGLLCFGLPIDRRRKRSPPESAADNGPTTPRRLGPRPLLASCAASSAGLEAADEAELAAPWRYAEGRESALDRLKRETGAGHGPRGALSPS